MQESRYENAEATLQFELKLETNVRLKIQPFLMKILVLRISLHLLKCVNNMLKWQKKPLDEMMMRISNKN